MFLLLVLLLKLHLNHLHYLCTVCVLSIYVGTLIGSLTFVSG